MRRSLPLPWRAPAWVWLGGLFLVIFLRFPVHFALTDPYLMDFEVYRSVAQRLALGEAERLYDPTSSELMLFKYAPLWALLWLPLAWLPAHAGAVLWASLTTAWLALGSWLSSCLSAQALGRKAPWACAAAVVLLARPISAEFLNGQVDLLWGLLVIGFLAAWLSRSIGWAALLLSLAISLKLPALIFLPYLLLRKQFRLAAQAIGFFILLNAFTCLLLDRHHPLRLISRWLHILLSSGASRAFEIGNQSLLALVSRFLSADGFGLNIASFSPESLLFAASAALVGLFLLIGLGYPLGRQEPLRTVGEGALLMILMVLGSPTTWIATYSALLLPATLALSGLSLLPESAGRRLASVSATLLLIALSLMTHSGFWKAVGLRHFRGESYVFLVFMVLPWFGLALFAHLGLHGGGRVDRRHERQDLPSSAPQLSAAGTSRSSPTGISPPSAP